MLQLCAPMICSSHRMDVCKSSKPGGDFVERMKEIKKNFAKDPASTLSDY
jgi:hypothetical protein